MLLAGTIILILKGAVIAVSLLLLGSLTALAYGKTILHGRINLVVFFLTISALLGLEVVARVMQPEIFAQFFEQHQAQHLLQIHLAFSFPSALLLPFMLFTGFRHSRRWHIGLGVLFLVFWVGTFVTGVFFLPHNNL